MTPKEFQLKHGFDDEDMDLIKACCVIFKGRLTKEPYVKQAPRPTKGLHGKTKARNPGTGWSPFVKP